MEIDEGRRHAGLLAGDNIGETIDLAVGLRPHPVRRRLARRLANLGHIRDRTPCCPQIRNSLPLARRGRLKGCVGQTGGNNGAQPHPDSAPIVRRIRDPGVKFDEMLVLEGPQGTNKSSALAILAVEEEWFSDDIPLTADEKRVIESLPGRWIVEAAELKGIRKGEVEHLKALLSRRVDRLGWPMTEPSRRSSVSSLSSVLPIAPSTFRT
jgi:hypothetical protein